MPFWMIHPQHGRMPVYDRGEVERVEKHGWTLLNEGESPAAQPVTATAPADAVVEVAGDTATVRRKPGRPRKGA